MFIQTAFAADLGGMHFQQESIISIGAFLIVALTVMVAEQDTTTPISGSQDQSRLETR